MIYDYCISGGGIIGLATAHKLLEMQPGASLLLIEKEQNFASHQSGHNSGVIHAGIYYVPGSSLPNHVWALDFQFDQTTDPAS